VSNGENLAYANDSLHVEHFGATCYCIHCAVYAKIMLENKFWL